MTAFDSYQSAARATAIYPGLGEQALYPVLGLCGEVAEVMQKLMEEAPGAELSKEMGDVLWYVASLASEHGEPLSQVASRRCSLAEEPLCFQDMAAPGEDELMRTAAELVVAAGVVAEVSKKVLRDRDGAFDLSSREKVLFALAGVLRHLATLCQISGLDLDEAAEGNQAKLASRAGRGVLSGSGDNR